MDWSMPQTGSPLCYILQVIKCFEILNHLYKLKLKDMIAENYQVGVQVPLFHFCTIQIFGLKLGYIPKTAS